MRRRDFLKVAPFVPAAAVAVARVAVDEPRPERVTEDDPLMSEYMDAQALWDEKLREHARALEKAMLFGVA